MDDTEGMCPDLADLFGAEVNGTTVTAFNLSGSQWYQLGVLFRALDFPEVNLGGLASKVGKLFHDSGEFQKYKGTWYGTVKGLSAYVDYLGKHQLELNNSLDRETAHIRCLILTNWLADVCGAPAEAGGLSAYPQECNAGTAPLDNESDPGAAIGSRTLAFDMAIFDRLRDNLLSRIPDLAASLPIADAVPLEQKLFAVMAMSVLCPDRRVDRPGSDSAGIWQCEDSISIADAVHRSMVSA